MNQYAAAKAIWPFYRIDDLMWRMWNNRRQLLRVDTERRRFSQIWSDDARATYLLATLLNAGRPVEAAQVYDGLFGSPKEMTTNVPLGHSVFVRHSALSALALHRSGRDKESRQVLNGAASAVRRTLAQERVPNWYHAIVAQLQAVSNQPDAALASLERATREGWIYSRERDSFADISLEPAFASLRGNPKFEKVRAEQRAIVAREAAKVRL